MNKIKWKWVEGSVDRSSDHIQITYGDFAGEAAEPLIPVALVGPPSGNVFPVQFLLSGSTPAELKMIASAKQELDFLLIEKGEKDPWAYALYHCTTAANIYDSLHWSKVLGLGKEKMRVKS